MKCRLGCVPYLNARPLVDAFESGHISGYTVRYDVPSQLPALLDDRSCAAVLVSSIEALRRPGARCAAGVSIGTRGAVRSVRLFSKVEFSAVRSLALDASSMTSNALAQIVLAEGYGSRPDVVLRPPDAREMLAGDDACVLIGDPGLAFDGTGLHVLDLGEAWNSLTGLPFVWALWVGGDELTDEVAAGLAEARRIGETRLATLGEGTGPGYLEGFDYGLGASALAGLETFRQMLTDRNRQGGHAMPEWVGARVASV